MEYTMKSTTDYKFFDDSLRKVRRLQGSHYPIIQGSLEIRSENSPSPPARIIREEIGIADCIFEATSYATMPGHGLGRLQELVRHPLPPDFIAFYERYAKALAVTLTYPLYFWSEDKMVEEINERREFLDRPMRTFRFGEQYEREATQYGLWLEEPGTMKWRVISTDSGVIDEDDDPYVEPDRIVGASFFEWFKEWMESDGASDPWTEGKFFQAVL
jgi:hypothetical protein